MKTKIIVVAVFFIITSIYFVITGNNPNSCEVAQYKNLFELQNKIFIETAESLKVNDAKSYGLLKEYISVHIETKKLNIYIAEVIERLEGVESKHFNTLGNIPKFLHGPRKTIGSNDIIYPYEALFKGDVFYTKKREYLTPLQEKYYFGVGISEEENQKYFDSRKRFEQLMKLHPSKNKLKVLWMKPLSELCKK